MFVMLFGILKTNESKYMKNLNSCLYTGGVPLYLERMKPELPVEQNIRVLCFTREGLLVREFDKIFSDLFSKKKASHKEIITCLANGSKDISQIQRIKKKSWEAYSKHLDDLVKAGFVQRDFT